MTDEKLRKMLSEMSHVWKTESAFMSWLRGGIRRMWSKHPVRIEFMKQNRIRIPNPNKNGKAKEVWGGVCAGQGFAGSGFGALVWRVFSRCGPVHPSCEDVLGGDGRSDRGEARRCPPDPRTPRVSPR